MLRRRSQTPRAARVLLVLHSLRARCSAAVPRRRAPPQCRRFSRTRTGPRSPPLLSSPLLPSARRSEEIEARKNGGAAWLAGAPPLACRFYGSCRWWRNEPASLDQVTCRIAAAAAFGVCCHRHPWSSPRHLEHA